MTETPLRPDHCYSLQVPLLLCHQCYCLVMQRAWKLSWATCQAKGMGH